MLVIFIILLGFLGLQAQLPWLRAWIADTESGAPLVLPPPRVPVHSPLFIYFCFDCIKLFRLHWSIPINNIVIASGRQQRDSAMYIHISMLPQIPSNFLPLRFPHNIEQSSLCYTVGPSWLCILKYNIVTFMYFKIHKIKYNIVT